MKSCPNCGAPNPARLTICFSCGHDLEATASIGRPSGPPVHHCPNCHAIVPPSASECSHCGRVSDADNPRADVSAPMFAVPVTVIQSQPLDTMTLPGWSIETLPDGAIRLRRSFWQRLNNETALPAICVVFGIFLMRPGGSRLPASPGEAGIFDAMNLFYAVGAVVSLVGLALAVWHLAAAEDIRLGVGFLECTKTLGPIVRRKRFDVIASIRGKTGQARDRNGQYTSRTLIVENLGQRINLDQRIRRESFFGIGAPAPAAEDDITRLGRLIAEITGWQFTDDLSTAR